MGRRTTTYRHRVRYLEADQQGVEFNMWYLGFFDEAMTLFLEEGGLRYEELLAAGFDVQLVRREIDWKAPDGTGKVPVPPVLSRALGEPS